MRYDIKQLVQDIHDLERVQKSRKRGDLAAPRPIPFSWPTMWLLPQTEQAAIRASWRTWQTGRDLILLAKPELTQLYQMRAHLRGRLHMKLQRFDTGTVVEWDLAGQARVAEPLLRRYERAEAIQQESTA